MVDPNGIVVSDLLQQLDPTQLGDFDSALNDFISTAPVLPPGASSAHNPATTDQHHDDASPASSPSSSSSSASLAAPAEPAMPSFRIDDKISQILLGDIDAADQNPEPSPDPEDLGQPDGLPSHAKELLSSLSQSVQTISDYFSNSSSNSSNSNSNASNSNTNSSSSIMHDSPKGGKTVGELGDDSRSKAIARLVRGNLATSIANIMKADLKPPLRLFDKRYSLWDVFELHLKSSSHASLAAISLDRAIRTINANHFVCDVHQRFRSLICVGLSEHRLDQWFPAFCQLNARALTSVYRKTAPLRNPIFVDAMGKTLRQLAHYPFHLSVEYEFVQSIGAKRPPPVQSPAIQTPASSDPLTTKEASPSS